MKLISMLSMHMSFIVQRVMTDLAIGQCTNIPSSILSSCTNLIRGCHISIVSFILTQSFEGVWGFDNYLYR